MNDWHQFRNLDKMSLKYEVAKHYDLKENISKEARILSPIIKFKNFCNKVKSILINKYVNSGDKILDLCAGKGGDITKFMKKKISEYVAIDISSKSILEAKRRFKRDYPKFKNAYFLIADVFGEEFLDDTKFDLISCQFAFHYAFEDSQRIDFAFRNLTKHLKLGGYFILTIPDDKVIRKRMDSGNKYYNISFETNNIYRFWLVGSLNVSEPIADRDTILYYATKYNLILIEENNFNYYYNRQNQKDLIYDPDELELVDIYKAMVFQLKE